MLGEGWNFSRCYQCGGFGLIRKAEINLVKVDRVPQGEQILLPELSGEPLMGQNAMQNLQQMRAEIHNQKNLKQDSEKALRKMAPPPKREQKKEIPISNTANMQAVPVPPPTSNNDVRTESARAATILGNLNAGINGNSNGYLNTNSTAAKKPMISPLLLVGLISMGAGGFLFVEGKRLVNQFRLNSEATDSTVSTAAAPQRTNQKPAQSESADALPNNANNGRTPEAAPATNTGVPVPASVIQNPGPAVAKVKARGTNILLREGPGVEFNAVGHADASSEYSVLESKDSWIHLQLPAGKTAWVRSDLVHSL